MRTKKAEELDPMIWFHLAKLSNLSSQAPHDVEAQMRQSINRLSAILTGQHKQEDEPESVETLRAIAEMLREE